MKASLGRLVLRGFSVIPVGIVFGDFFYYPGLVSPGDSGMSNVFQPGSLVLISRLAGSASPSRGDIVSMASPSERGTTIYRRVVGLGGDFVRPQGQELSSRMNMVPTGSMWVECDSGCAAVSCDDSNQFGPVSMALVNGRVKYATGVGRIEGKRVPGNRVITGTQRYN